MGPDEVKRTHIKVYSLLPPQDWKEQYIHENYSRALEGEGLVEQVSLTQHPSLPDGRHPLGPPSGLVVSKLTSLRCLRVFCSGKMKAKADQIGVQLPTPALLSEPLLSTK